MIKYKIEGRALIKTCVRLNKMNQLELFYYGVNGLECFTFAEGHNVSSLQYMYDCELVDQAKAETFLFAYNSYYSNIDNERLHVYSKRLSSKFKEI